jgi:3-oxoacyl-(acyl-carrier-protein) synthase III
VKPFVVNRRGRLVLPAHFAPEIDFTRLGTLEELSAMIHRDFDDKAPTGAELLRRIEARAYSNRYELLRDLALHLFWVNRYSITMYEKRPTAWRHVPKRRDDVFIPVVTPWRDAERKVTAVQAEFARLPSAWHVASEYRIFTSLFDIFSHRRHHAPEQAAIKPTVAEILADPDNTTFLIGLYDPDFPTFSYEDLLDCHDDVPELEALLRWTMILYNQYPWHRPQVRLTSVGRIRDDDVVVLYHPRNHDVLQFIRRVKSGRHRARAPAASEPARPVHSCPAVIVSRHFAVQPRLESLAAVKGEVVCTNEDLVRNAACHWRAMSAPEILEKTGIERRLYTQRTLEDISVDAARRALAHAGRDPREIGAVICCTCTSARLMPSIATRISSRLGMYQTHASFDLVAACAGMVYGLAECVRLLQEVRCPVILVCAEKFSDKVGDVRPSRMIFGDGAAALVLGPAERDTAGDLLAIQTYASGPLREVNSIIWPNPEFANGITVYGPEVRAFVKRYLIQMMQELSAMPAEAGEPHRVLDTIDLVIPHQANRTMITDLAAAAGLAAERLYFNIDKVGNTSAASIPIAIADAVAEGVIRRTSRLFTPGFGAGAVAGYAVMRLDPRVVAPENAARAPRPVMTEANRIVPQESLGQAASAR